MLYCIVKVTDGGLALQLHRVKYEYLCSIHITCISGILYLSGSVFFPSVFVC